MKNNKVSVKIAADILNTARPWPFARKTPTLAELQAAVGGYIELVQISTGPRNPTPSALTMVVDEDGISKGLPYNFEASSIASRNIFGDVLLLSPSLLR